MGGLVGGAEPQHDILKEPQQYLVVHRQALLLAS
jgi:hypothetical protein